MSPVATRPPELDQACAEAIDLARAAAEDDAGPGKVGEHIGVHADGDRVATHLFATLDPSYVGWRWAVTVTRAARAKAVTVSECLLLPGPDSLLAPPWVPWTERVRPGDLKAGDLMPAPPDDERLVPLVAIAGDDGLLDLAQEVVVGPSRVLSPVGRDQAAARWHAGPQGPLSRLARSAPATCLTCGFMVRLSGALGGLFGVCTNEFAPDDGQVVALDHGCGAHSDGAMTADDELAAEAGSAPPVDELGYDMMTTGAAVPDSVLETIDHELS